MKRLHKASLGRIVVAGAVVALIAFIALAMRPQTVLPKTVRPAAEATPPTPVPAPTPVAGSGSEPVSLAGPLQAAMVSVTGAAATSLPSAARDQLRVMYEGGGWETLWVDEALHPHADAREALQLLAGSAREGLDPSDYEAAALNQKAIALSRTQTPPAADVAEFDVALSTAMVLYMRDLHLGRVDPRAIGFRMASAAEEHDFPSLLLAAVRDHRLTAATAELEPQTVFYRGLRAALLRYRSFRANEVAAVLPPSSGRAVRPGEAYQGLALLRSRLVLFGDWPDGATEHAPDPPVYQGPWVDAVKRFQSRHGLEADGVLGAETLAALRVPVEWRIRQIEMGLERLRWLPHVPKGPIITVNVAMFHLWAWDAMGSAGMPAFESRVIVGRALDTETPVFEEEMSHIIFRPYWNVPPSIVRDEIIPALARDDDYLRRQDMEIVDGPGDNARVVDVNGANIDRLRNGRLRVRQRPGPGNALGLAKFVFPNDENVYLHGTPATGLFDRTRRDLSHGCVRVEDPVALAEWALSAHEKWNRDRIVTAMNGSSSTRVDLTTPVPVILFYSTALVMPDNGAVHFSKDIYGQDEKLDRALGQRIAARH